jgi:hypothetical protein
MQSGFIIANKLLWQSSGKLTYGNCPPAVKITVRFVRASSSCVVCFEGWLTSLHFVGAELLHHVPRLVGEPAEA